MRGVELGGIIGETFRTSKDASLHVFASTSLHDRASSHVTHVVHIRALHIVTAEDYAAMISK